VRVKMMVDRYPVQSYFHRCGLVPSPDCPYCQDKCETLALPRGPPSNQVRAKLTSLLAKCLTKQWKLFEETSMRRTELQLQQVSVACMVAAGRLPQGHQGDPVCVGNLQLNMVLVSQPLNSIGLLDLCRPFNSPSEQLPAAVRRKLCTYGPLLEALRVYVADG
jgi:hypothetical protein